jgi:hypothetical protein
MKQVELGGCPTITQSGNSPQSAAVRQVAARQLSLLPPFSPFISFAESFLPFFIIEFVMLCWPFYAYKVAKNFWLSISQRLGQVVFTLANHCE